MRILSMTEQKHLKALPLCRDEPLHSISLANTLVEVATQLGKARAAAESTGDSMLLYLVDMAILHVCDSVCQASRPGIADDLERKRVEMVRALAQEIE